MKRMKIKSLLTLLILLTVSVSFAQTPINIVPKPVSIKQGDGKFLITPKLNIIYTQGLDKHAELLGEYISPATGYDFKILQGIKKTKGSIFITKDTTIKEEGYILDVDNDYIVIKGGDEAGVFNAIQTLLQLLPADIYSQIRKKDVEWVVPQVSINDYPQFAWRGVMLDVARYFMSKDYVYKFIDMMAMYKANMLHLHLVDDAGWRIEIKKYPLLTEIGGYRGEGANRTGGFYTQQDLKEMVEYAKLRNVTIVPEIEFPAHILSAISAYPWLGCRGLDHKVPEQHFISRDLICVGKETSIQFLSDVLDETFALFPSKYIHIGGDEAVYDYWDKCPDCTALRDKLGFKNSSELQSYLTNEVAGMAAKHGRTILGWDEIVERGKLTHKVASMVWRSMSNSEKAISQGHEVLFAPADYAYFDFPESNTPGEVKAATWKAPISVKKIYELDLSDFEGNKSVLGIQACLWTDQFIHGTMLQEMEQINENRSEKYVDYLMLPRLLAMSENAWLPSKDHNFEDFENRLSTQYERLDNAGFSYRVPEPKVVSVKQEPDGYTIELKPTVKGAKICYTTNGILPNIHSKEYEKAVKVGDISDFRAITVVSDTHVSLPVYFPETYDKFTHLGVQTKKIAPSDIDGNDFKEITIDVTGKVSSNGAFTFSFAGVSAGADAVIGDIALYKRDDKIGEAKGTNNIKHGVEGVVSRAITVEGWEAGTPFSIKVKIKGADNNKGNIVLFIGK